MIFTHERDMYTKPCLLMLLGSNTSCYQFNPCALCIVLAQASCIGNCLFILQLLFPLGDLNSFATQNIGVHILSIVEPYNFYLFSFVIF